MLHDAEEIAVADEGDSFRRIARVIRFLAANYMRQPDLDEAARAAGWSPFHLQREFLRHTGVTPKNFVAHLTLEHAKRSLSAGDSVLAAALEAGLSGASRLHDLCLKVEAMTPGAYAKGGAGLTIAHGFHDTIFGSALLLATERGVCGLAFCDAGEEDAMLADMRARWPAARHVADPQRTAIYARRIFSPQARGREALPVQLFGTPWQIKVWQALLAIAPGSIGTYRGIARTVCTERAARAVGAAIGRNPIALLIPCHRVLASSGALTGYHWGMERKRALLAWEAAQAAEQSA